MEGHELTAASVGGASAELSRLWSSIRVRSRGVPPERSRSARWRLLTTRLGSAIQLVGDGILVTDAAIIRRAIGERVANAALIKLNQIGTCRRRSRPSPQRAQAATARSSATGPVRRPTTSLSVSPWRRAPARSRPAHPAEASTSRSTTSGSASKRSLARRPCTRPGALSGHAEPPRERSARWFCVSIWPTTLPSEPAAACAWDSRNGRFRCESVLGVHARHNRRDQRECRLAGKLGESHARRDAATVRVSSVNSCRLVPAAPARCEGESVRLSG